MARSHDPANMPSPTQQCDPLPLTLVLMCSQFAVSPSSSHFLIHLVRKSHVIGS